MTTISVAILDLSRVAEETGMASKMQETLQSVQQQLGEQLEQTRQKARQRVQSLAQDMGENPTQKQQQAFAREQANLQAALNRAQQRAQQGFTGLRGQLSARFGDAVRPIAREIARQRGMEVILLAGGNLYDHDDSVEITDAVLSKVEQQIEAGEFDWSPEKVFEEIREAQQAGQDAADLGASDGVGAGDGGASNGQ